MIYSITASRDTTLYEKVEDTMDDVEISPNQILNLED